MKKFVKPFIIACIIILLLFTCAAMALRILLPPEKLKTFITEKVSSQIGRKIELEKASAGIFTGLKFVNVRVSEKPDFSKGVLFEAGELFIMPDISGLLRNKMILHSITLKSPHITIIKHHDNVFNFSDLTDSGKKPASVHNNKIIKNTDNAQFEFVIGRVRITDGTIDYSDEIDSGTHAKARSLTCDIRSMSLKNPFSAQVSFETEGILAGKPVNGLLHFNGKVDPAELLFSKASLTIKELDITVPGIEVNMQGRLKNITAPLIDMTLRIKKIDLEKLKDFVPLPEDMHINGSPHGDIKIKGTVPDVTISGSLDMNKVDVRIGDIFQKGQGTLLNIEESELQWSNNELHFAPFRFSIDNALTTIEGVIKYPVNNNASMDLTFVSQPLPLSGLIKLFPITSLHDVQGTLEADTFKCSGPLKSISLHGSAKLKDVSARLGNLDIQNLSTLIDCTPDNIRIVHLSGNLDGKPFNCCVNINNYNTLPDISLDGSVTVLDLGKLTPDTKDLDKPTKMSRSSQKSLPEISDNASVPKKSRGSFTIDTLMSPYFSAYGTFLKWDLDGIASTYEDLNGTATIFISKGGKFKELDRTVKHSRILKVVLFPVYILQTIEHLDILRKIGVHIPSFSDISYNKMTGDYSLKNGLLSINTFRFEGTTLDFETKGTVNLVTENLKLETTVKVLRDVIQGTLGKLLSDEAAIPAVTLNISGTISDPKVRPDIIKTGKKVIEEIIDQIPGFTKKRRR